jgi:stage II sporulation protein R
MGGVFMKKFAKYLWISLILAFVFSCATAIVQKRTLKESVIRFHVVAHSDDQKDQQLKLLVRDAILEELQPAISALPNMDAAKTYLQENLHQIQKIADNALMAAGSDQRSRVTLEQETFGFRRYDTFALPSGVYESLRISIGEAQGKNWWCVVFPSLCMPAVGENFSDAAAGAGFDDGLANTLQQKKGYEIRFFFLDWLGWLENLFFRK